MKKGKKKSGFVAIIGRPNVGKSTIVNALVGTKISITGPKAQTTRNKILGILTEENTQIVFVDTPGMLKPTNKLGQFMKKSIETALDGNDLILIVLDGTDIKQADYDLIQSFEKSEVPVFVVINKTDIATFEKVYPKLEKLNQYGFISEFVSISAKTGKNLDELKSKIIERLPDGEFMFDEGDITDKSVRFISAEIVREKALLYLQQEIPHGIAVDIPRFEEGDGKVSIDADIIASKENHKQIIIGKKGEMLKKIGTSARTEIETLVGKKVFLNLFVKVKENWQDSQSSLNELGYNKKDI